MKFEIELSDLVFSDARLHAERTGTTLEALVSAYVEKLAAIKGRRLTLREQINCEHEPPEELVRALLAEADGLPNLG